MTRILMATAGVFVAGVLGWAGYQALAPSAVEDPLTGSRSIDAIGAGIGGEFALSGHDGEIHRSEALIDG
ncbi:MAG: hypothetical protein AAFT19_08575, partial [Pseudomonadota bacterium]